MTNRPSLKQYAFLCAALFLCALGIAFVTNAHLGTTPITTVPYVLGKICGLSLGTFTFIANMLFIILQAVILHEKLSLKHYIQIPTVIVFSIFIDICMHLTSSLISTKYSMQLFMVLAGSCILGMGIALEIACRCAVVPGEGLVLAIAYRTKLIVGNVKVLFDSGLVLCAILLSLLSMHAVMGVREGTVLSAVLVGNFVRLFIPLTSPLKNIL